MMFKPLILVAIQAATVLAACKGTAVNSATISFLQEHEGFVPNIYKDSGGKDTVGYGHLCQKSGCSEVKYHIPLTKADGAKLLQSDLSSYQNCLSDSLNDKVKLNPNQYGALVSWTYNVGCGSVAQSTLRTRLNKGENPTTVVEQELPKWNKVNGKSNTGLTNRRNAEIKLFKTPASGVAHPPSC